MNSVEFRSREEADETCVRITDDDWMRFYNYFELRIKEAEEGAYTRSKPEQSTIKTLRKFSARLRSFFESKLHDIACPGLDKIGVKPIMRVAEVTSRGGDVECEFLYVADDCLCYSQREAMSSTEIFTRGELLERCNEAKELSKRGQLDVIS